MRPKFDEKSVGVGASTPEMNRRSVQEYGTNGNLAFGGGLPI